MNDELPETFEMNSLPLPIIHDDFKMYTSINEEYLTQAEVNDLLSTNDIVEITWADGRGGPHQCIVLRDNNFVYAVDTYNENNRKWLTQQQIEFVGSDRPYNRVRLIKKVLPTTPLIDGINAKIDDVPNETWLRGVLAEAMMESGIPILEKLAEGYQELARLNRCPFLNHKGYGWYNWEFDGDNSKLPTKWLKAIGPLEEVDTMKSRRILFATRRLAEDAAALGWLKWKGIQGMFDKFYRPVDIPNTKYPVGDFSPLFNPNDLV